MRRASLLILLSLVAQACQRDEATAPQATRPSPEVFSGSPFKILFTSSRDGNYQIYAMNADGSGQTRLAPTASYDHHPSPSPDGRRIAFVSNRDGNEEIYV